MSQPSLDVSDPFVEKCYGCGEIKKVCTYSDDNIEMCDDCVVSQAKYRDSENFRKVCPPKHWTECFPEVVEKLKKHDAKNNRKRSTSGIA